MCFNNAWLFLFCLVMLEPSLDSPPKYPNIGYLGSCYDIFNGNPETTKGLDPGLKSLGIFQFTYNRGLTTADGRYSIPDGTTVNDAQSCSFSFFSDITKNTGSYMDSIKIYVDASFKGWGASFSASTDYQDMEKSTQSGETVFVSSQARCEAYGASINDAEFTDNFINTVSYLPVVLNSSTREIYISFIQEYGTHVLTSLMMGGRYGVRSEFKTSNYSSLASSGINVKASAGYSGLVHVGGSLDTDVKKEAAEKFNNLRSSFKIYQVGGDPPVDVNGTAFEWAQTVKKYPLPLSYSLKEIYKYFTSRYFPNDANIDRKRENLRNMTGEYCVLTVPDTSLCQKDYGPTKTNAIHVITVNKYIAAEIADPSQKIVFAYCYKADPNFRNLGAVFGRNLSAIHLIMIDVRHAPSDLVVSPIGVHGYGNFNYTLRYLCPEGYSTVSDNIQSTIGMPYTHVCLANHCLTQCTKVKTEVNNIFLIGNGFPELGNSGSIDTMSFFRDLSIPDNTPEDDLFKCLKYDCLTFNY